MPSIALARTDAIIGVDTHKDQHVAVAVDGLGGRLAERFVPATTAGYGQLQSWAADQGRVVAFGIEGTGSYGIGLTRFLRRNGHTVHEVARPPRKAERRLLGRATPSTPSTPHARCWPAPPPPSPSSVTATSRRCGWSSSRATLRSKPTARR